MFVEDNERKKANEALKKLEFQDHIQIEGVLFILKLFQYDKFSTLLGVSKKIYKIKGLERFIDEHRCRHHIDVILDYLDHRGIFDKLHGNLHAKLFLPIRQNFLRRLIRKMENFLENNEEVFNDHIFEEHQSELVHISHILRHKDKKTIPDAIKVLGIPHQEAVSEYITENFEALRRLCVVEHNSTISILESRDRFIDVQDELLDKSFDLEQILNSKFLTYGIDFFISPEFFAGLVTSLYGVLAAAIIATALSVLALAGMTLAVASLVCTVVFCIFIPMVMGSAITSFVEWLYDEIKESFEESMRSYSQDYDNKLTSAGYYAAKEEESSVEQLDNDFDLPYENSLSLTASA